MWQMMMLLLQLPSSFRKQVYVDSLGVVYTQLSKN
jgi:hypothetical protein